MFVKSTKVTQLQDRGRYVSPSLKVVNSRHIRQQARSEAKPPRLQRKSKLKPSFHLQYQLVLVQQKYQTRLPSESRSLNIYQLFQRNRGLAAADFFEVAVTFRIKHTDSLQLRALGHVDNTCIELRIQLVLCWCLLNVGQFDICNFHLPLSVGQRVLRNSFVSDHDHRRTDKTKTR